MERVPVGLPSAADLLRSRKPIPNANLEHAQRLTALQRLALTVTEHVGTMGFFFVIAAWTLLWLGWNLVAPPRLVFDRPMAFAIWLFVSNLIQILLMPLIMVGQNVQALHAEVRAENDHEVNLRTEREVEAVLRYLEDHSTRLKRIEAALGGGAPAP